MVVKKREEKAEGQNARIHSIKGDAETQLARTPPKNFPDRSGKKAEKHTPDIQIHSIEHEIPADELSITKLAFEESRDKSLDLYEFAPLGYFTLNDKGLITDVNLAGATLLGIERNKLVKSLFRKCIAEKDSVLWHRYFSNVLKQGPIQSCNLTLLRGDGSSFPANLQGIRITGIGGAPIVRVAFTDITDVWQVEEPLQQALDNLETQVRERRAQQFDATRTLLTESGERKKTKVTLPEIAKKYRLIAEHAQDMIYRMSLPDGKYEYVSPAAVQITGYYPEDYYSDPGLARKLLHDDWQDYFKKEWEALLKGDMSPFYEYPIIDRVGKTRWLNQRNVLVKDESGQPVAIEGIVTDITERKHMEDVLRDNERKYRSIFDNAVIGIYQVSNEGRFLSANNRVAQILGYESADELIESIRDIDTQIYKDPKHRKEAKRILLDSGVLENFEVPCRHKDGQTVWVSLNARLVRDAEGNIRYHEGTCQDITERKQLELERDYHEQELLQISTSLDMAIKKLTLLSSISRHDINNQLTGILGYVDMLQSMEHEPKIKAYYQTISAAAQHITSLIRFTKEYEKIGINPPLWQDCHALLNSSASDVAIGHIRLINDLPSGANVFADPLFAKVFYNLLNFAVQHDSKITTIRFTVADHNENKIIVCEDDGDGVRADEKERIFERGDGKNAGVGLFLTREILSITGITLKETGEPGKGSRFEIEVPKGAWR